MIWDEVAKVGCKLDKNFKVFGILSSFVSSKKGWNLQWKLLNVKSCVQGDLNSRPCHKYLAAFTQPTCDFYKSIKQYVSDWKFSPFLEETNKDKMAVFSKQLLSVIILLGDELTQNCLWSCVILNRISTWQSLNQFLESYKAQYLLPLLYYPAELAGIALNKKDFFSNKQACFFSDQNKLWVDWGASEY